MGLLILRKIIEIVATNARCHTLKLNASNSISWGLRPRPPGGAYTQRSLTP